MDEIIEEYFLKKEFSDTIIKSYLHILVTNLVRDYQFVEQEPQSKTRKIVIEILDEIDKEFNTITLQKIASKYGYNKNYLSNLFKKRGWKAVFRSSYSKENDASSYLDNVNLTSN